MSLKNLSIKNIQNLFEKNELTSVELTEFYLERIAKFNDKLNAIIEINPDVLDIAFKMDQERKNGKVRSQLHGVPFVIKGNIDTADKMRTSAGALALKNNFTEKDAYIVKLLRKAGAVLIGKANLSEFANFISFDLPNGFSAVGGQTKNAYGDHDTGGSSSGSAVSVAADFCAFAIGTETSGSILSPASSSSCVGLKPTTGSISRSGIIPISQTQDTAGPITRNVEDSYLVFKEVVGYDKKDIRTFIAKDYNLKKIKEESFKNKKFGYNKQVIDFLSDSQKELWEETIKMLEENGAEIIPFEYENINKISNINVLFYEFKHGLNDYLKDKKVEVKTLTDVIKFNQLNKKAIPYGQSILLKSDSTSGYLTEKEYLESLLNDRKYSRKEGIDKVMKEFSLDAIISPANFGAMVPAKAGYPSITVPTGYSDLGPMGFTFTHKAGEEMKIIALAELFEKMHDVRKLPEME
ncbi:MAG: amidase family protein [Thermotogota bacterium]